VFTARRTMQRRCIIPQAMLCTMSLSTSRRVLSPSSPPPPPKPLQGKAPKEIHAILTETLACFLLGRAKDLSAPLNRISPPWFRYN